MTGTIHIDLREFEAFLPQYAAAKKRDLASQITRQVGQLAYFGAAHAPKTDRRQIEALPGKVITRPGRKRSTEWWPAFIQKILSNGGYILHGRRKARGAEVSKGYRDPGGLRAFYGTQRTIGYNRLISNKPGGDARRKGDLQRVSKKILSHRIATIGWLRGVLGKVAGDFGINKGGNRTGKFRRFWTSTTAAPDNLLAGFRIPFASNRYAGDWPGGTRPSQMQSALTKRQQAEDALTIARDEVILDMQKHVAAIMAKRFEVAA